MHQILPDDSGVEPSDCTLTLAEVVALARKKDRQARAQAFEILYKVYQEPIKRHLVKLVHDQERAADYCQDTFEHFLYYLSRQDTTIPETVNHFKNWLFRIASNVAIDELRRKKSIDFLPLPENEAYARFAELMAEGDEDRICDLLWLQDEVPQMPQQQRECLLAKHYWGYSQKEIAAKKGISESAVSAYVSLGKTHLRRKYYPVTADIKRILEGMDIELLIKGFKEYIRLQIHRAFMDGTSWDKLDDFLELCRLHDRRYTREQVRYLDEEQFNKEVLYQSPTIETAYPVYNDTSAFLFVRPSELLIVRGVKIITAN